VEIVVSTYHLGLGGIESYALTVAEQLQRLGHDVTVFYVELGPGLELGQDRGLEIRSREDELPERCDIVFAQDAITAYQLADRYPETPQVMAVHADEYDFTTPPQLRGVVAAVVVLNDRVERQVRAFGLVPEIVRLRQPVDTKRFYPRTALNDPPKRALLLGNYVDHDRRELVARACAEAGIEVRQLGATSGRWATEPEVELCTADIVFGKARVIVEAMACGRAAYVYDHNGGDGWVTTERYELLERDNFGGQAEATVTDSARLRADLATYTPELGQANRDLAVANHSASRHGQELVDLFSRLAPGPRERIAAPLREMSRLTRLQWASEARATGFAAEVLRLRAELDQANARAANGHTRTVRRGLRAFARRFGAGEPRERLLELDSSKESTDQRAHSV
jgi:hypothetical protein